VFWALLFLSSQGKIELEQHGGLFGPLSLRRRLEAGETTVQLPLPGSAHGAALTLRAA
jgi:segregation and condensation protein A